MVTGWPAASDADSGAAVSTSPHRYDRRDPTPDSAAAIRRTGRPPPPRSQWRTAPSGGLAQGFERRWSRCRQITNAGRRRHDEGPRYSGMGAVFKGAPPIVGEGTFRALPPSRSTAPSPSYRAPVIQAPIAGAGDPEFPCPPGDALGQCPPTP